MKNLLFEFDDYCYLISKRIPNKYQANFCNQFVAYFSKGDYF